MPNSVNCIAVDPKNTNLLYAGTDGNGVFKSINAGNLWESMNNGFTGYLGMSFLALDSTNSQKLYAGVLVPSSIWEYTNLVPVELSEFQVKVE
jgi:hypothetical protein